MRCPSWIYRWIDRRGKIPSLAFRLWPTAHWCDAMDGLLILDNVDGCFCGWSRPIESWDREEPECEAGIPW